MGGELELESESESESSPMALCAVAGNSYSVVVPITSTNSRNKCRCRASETSHHFYFSTRVHAHPQKTPHSFSCLCFCHFVFVLYWFVAYLSSLKTLKPRHVHSNRFYGCPPPAAVPFLLLSIQHFYLVEKQWLRTWLVGNHSNQCEFESRFGFYTGAWWVWIWIWVRHRSNVSYLKFNIQHQIKIKKTQLR